MSDDDSGEFAEPVDPETLQSLPMEPGEVWQADLRPMPMWINGENEPYRPWVALVLDKTNDFVLANEMTPDEPDAEWLSRAVAIAMRKPSAGEPHRPGLVEVVSAKHRDALCPCLDQAGIECAVVKKLVELDAAFDTMAQYLGDQGGPPSLLDAPGMEPSHIGGFYAAAADFYRQKPWRNVLGDTVIQVECDKFQSGPWYAIVMGQSGVQQGVAVYEDLDSLQAMMSGMATDEENAKGMSAMSMMFSEAFDMPPRDLAAAEQHEWPVASPEAYPMVLRINPGMAFRPPLVWELELLEGCLRTIPDFLTDKTSPFSKTASTASGSLNLRLSWVE